MKKTILVTGLIFLWALEISGIYFLMPFPGSQQMDSIAFAYWIHNNKFWMRLLLLSIILFSLVPSFRRARVAGRIFMSLGIILYAVIFYYTNLRFQADRLFIQLKTKLFADARANTVDSNRLVIGVINNGEAKAYPIQIIGYHHQVRDTLGNTPLMITYCTVCRTGRVFSPEVNGQPESFRLVGMDHFNAMFEDSRTKSWWRQATGVAVAGKLKGQSLKEIPSTQSTLRSWLARYPNSLILQPDTLFNKRYASLKDFDNGTTTDELEKRDSASWQFKSWVIGVEHGDYSKAYDWNMLAEKNLIQDSLPGAPLMITLESDTATYHVLSRLVNGNFLRFTKVDQFTLADIQTGSTWTLSGACVNGTFKGEQLASIKSSQEFWHSWQTFHPRTLVYKN